MRKKSKAGRQRTKPSLHELAVDDDVIVSDDDERLLDEHGESIVFLARLNPANLVKEAKQAPIARSKQLKSKTVLSLTDEGENDSKAALGQGDLAFDEELADISYGEVEEDEDDLETRYEQLIATRLSKVDDDGDVARLPFRTVDGRFITNQEKLEAPEVNLKGTINPRSRKAKKQLEQQLPPSPPTSYASNNEEEKVGKQTLLINKKMANMTPEEKLVAQQEALASLASAIIGDPEKHVDGLKTLREISQQRSDIRIRKLSLLTQLTIYKDIIPGYRIRQLTESEKNARVSKDVKKQRTFEQALVTQYQAYLQSLYSIVNAARKKAANCKEGTVDEAAENLVPLALVAINCMTELLTSVTHFNFRNNLMDVLVGCMTDSLKSPLLDAIPKCCQAFQMVFEQDESGEASLEGVQLIAQAAKAKRCKIDERVLETFLSLRLRDELPVTATATSQERTSKKRKRAEPHVSRKLRKVMKKNDELDQELKEAAAEVDKDERQKLHTETLKHVFATYFRILKDADGSPLLPTVLEGLAKFSHLINVDFFSDLLAILKKISASQYEAYQSSTSNKNHHNANSSLHCVIAAFRLLSGQGEVLNIDLKEFSTALYQQLPEMTTRSSSSLNNEDPRRDVIVLLLTGMEMMLLKKKQVPIDRVAAFAKRLASLSTQLPHHGTLACLSVLRALLIKYPKLGLMLDSEGRLGEYNPHLEDPDLCTPFATSLYEFHVLRHHYHPYVRDMTRHIASLTFNEMPVLPTVMSSTAIAMGPVEIYRKFGRPLFDPPFANIL